MITFLDQALSMTVLGEAWEKVRSNRGGPGSDGETLETFERNLTSNLVKMRDQVRSAAYAPRPLLGVVIEEPGKKPRRLAIPSVRDRVLQTAVARVLTPLFEAEFEDCSFAYRKGFSVDQAIRHVIRYRDAGFRWVVDADISAFFDEIDHTVLLSQLQELVKEPRLLALIRLWLEGELEEDGQLSRIEKGVAQGSPISPLLSNLYLDHLDEALVGKNLRLVRFADDFLILCKDKARAEQALDLTEAVLTVLKLSLNRAKTRIVDFERGFRFLGVQFVRSLVLDCRYPEAEAVDPDRGLPHEEPVETKSVAPTSDGDQPSALGMALAEALAEDRLETAPNGEAEGEARASVVAIGAEEKEAAEQTPSAGHSPRLQTLYLLEHGCTLGKEYERLVIRRGDEVLKEIPAIQVDQIMVFGNSQITTQAMNYCLLEKIPIVLLSSKGRYYGVVDSLDTDPVLLHRAQFARADDVAFCLAVAKDIVAGKLANMRLILRRYARKREVAGLTEIEANMGRYPTSIKNAESLEIVRG